MTFLHRISYAQLIMHNVIYYLKENLILYKTVYNSTFYYNYLKNYNKSSESPFSKNYKNEKRKFKILY